MMSSQILCNQVSSLILGFISSHQYILIFTFLSRFITKLLKNNLEKEWATNAPHFLQQKPTERSGCSSALPFHKKNYHLI
jgi:hypothetical protein